MLRRVIAYGLVVAALIPLALLLIYILVKSRPPGYTRATDYTTRELEQHAKEFQLAGSRVVNTLHDASGQTPLDVTFTDVGVTSQLRILPPDDLRRLPDWLSNPQVIFTPEAIVLMGDISGRGGEATISLHMVPTVTADGNIGLRLAETRAGRMPLPEAVNRQARDSLQQKIAEQRSRLQAQALNPAGQPDKRQVLALQAMEAGLQLLMGEEAVIDTQSIDLVVEQIVLDNQRLRLIGRHPKSAPAGGGPLQ